MSSSKGLSSTSKAQTSMMSKATNMSSTLKSVASTTSIRSPSSTKPAAKKKELSPEHLADLEFLRGLSAQCLEQDVRRVLSIFATAREKKSKELLVGASETIVLICSDQLGFTRFVETEGVEPVASVAADPPEAGSKYSGPAVHGLCRGAAVWLDDVDPVDFTELSRLLYLTLWLGGLDEDVAVSAVAAIKRFTLHRAEHAAGMLKAGVLNVLHRLLSVHRSPEFVVEVFVLLYLLCDMPVEAVGEHLLDELELVTTVIEALQGAPLNMRVQVAGLRLLAMWASRLRSKEEISEAIENAGAKELLESAVQKLRSSGFLHAAAWLTAMAGRALSENLDRVNSQQESKQESV